MICPSGLLCRTPRIKIVVAREATQFAGDLPGSGKNLLQTCRLWGQRVVPDDELREEQTAHCNMVARAENAASLTLPLWQQLCKALTEVVPRFLASGRGHWALLQRGRSR